VRAKIAGLLGPPEELPVRRTDVLAADIPNPPARRVLARAADGSLTVNWVMTPPARGSGGHTTAFRIINELGRRGHRNRVYFYDIYLADHAHYAAIARTYYGFDGQIANVDDGMVDADVVVATGWPTAYPVFNSRAAGLRFYFVQDFEPFFHATSASSVLAENTYRMGFHGITAGRWLARKLRTDYAMAVDHFDFGCDLATYARRAGSERRGIAFYVRPSAPRRASALGLMAIELFAGRHPEIEIHLYGDKVGRQPFRFVDHGRVSPQCLDAIYNRCCSGISLSLTNVSLVPHEMLACGCIPVVNDAEHNRIVLDNPFVRYAPLTPQALAAALEAVVATSDFDALSEQASRSVRSASWQSAAQSVEAAFRRALA